MKSMSFGPLPPFCHQTLACIAEQKPNVDLHHNNIIIVVILQIIMNADIDTLKNKLLSLTHFVVCLQMSKLMSWKDTVNYTHVMRMCRGGSYEYNYDVKHVMCFDSPPQSMHFVYSFESNINYQPS